MKTLHTRKGGFTLIELMIVVAIIGILAAIAIPNFLRFQLRAKSSEGKTNLAAIRTAEESYFSEFGTYVAAAPWPAAPLTTKQVWVVPAVGFDTMGWSPEGEVYFEYEVAAAAPPAAEFLATAVGDLDGDAVTQQWGYVKPLPAALTYAGPAPTIGNPICANNGVYNAANPANPLLTTVGPCDAVSGQSVF
jgi:type IV pilus assembly protein PilA